MILDRTIWACLYNRGIECWLERQEVAGRHVLAFCQHVDSGLKGVRTKGSQFSDAVVTDSAIFAPAPALSVATVAIPRAKRLQRTLPRRSRGLLTLTPRHYWLKRLFC
jgi:hypothetical protein